MAILHSQMRSSIGWCCFINICHQICHPNPIRVQFLKFLNERLMHTSIGWSKKVQPPAMATRSQFISHSSLFQLGDHRAYPILQECWKILLEPQHDIPRHTSLSSRLSIQPFSCARAIMPRGNFISFGRYIYFFLQKA